MPTLVPIADFVAFLQKQLAGGAGYIMGTTGQIMTEKNLKNYAEWQGDYSPERYIELGKRWLGKRCFDCNGLAEGFYEDVTGVCIDSKARFNFAIWCDGANGSDMATMPLMPGVAVFIHSAKRGYITHVGFLEKPVDSAKPNSDWYVIEARGVNYGVVRTRLSERGWNRWGLMVKYFKYPDYSPQTYELGDRTLKNGLSGDDVRQLQSALISLGYPCGKYGADGEFGSATKAALIDFQRDEDIDDDGIFGAISYQALLNRLNPDTPDTPDDSPDSSIAQKFVTVTGNSVNLRFGPGKEHDIFDTVHKNDKLAVAGADAWLPVMRDGSDSVFWISKDYVKDTE